jgi:hypothetical protein
MKSARQLDILAVAPPSTMSKESESNRVRCATEGPGLARCYEDSKVVKGGVGEDWSHREQVESLRLGT